MAVLASFRPPDAVVSRRSSIASPATASCCYDPVRSGRRSRRSQPTQRVTTTALPAEHPRRARSNLAVRGCLRDAQTFERARRARLPEGLKLASSVPAQLPTKAFDKFDVSIAVIFTSCQMALPKNCPSDVGSKS